MLSADELAEMRATSAAALPDTCRITRPGSGPAVLDPATGSRTPPEPVLVYAGPCRLRPRGSQEQDVQHGDLHETLGPYVATLPASSTDAPVEVQGDPASVQVDDYLALVTSSDQAATSRTWQVRHVGWSSNLIDRRIGLEDREQPAGTGLAPGVDGTGPPALGGAVLDGGGPASPGGQALDGGAP